MKKIVLFVCTLLCITALSAQHPGELDPTFGDQGISIYPVNDSYDKCNDVKVQPDGKILMAGVTRKNGCYFLQLVRHNSDGSTDGTFGYGGFATFIPTTYYGNFAMETATLPDGKIIVAGYVYDSNSGDVEDMLLKVNEDGTLDTSFGDNGVVIGSHDVDVTMEACKVQADGKIVMAGYINDKMSAIRYNADGQLDTSFGDNGNVSVLIDDVFNSFATDVLIQPDGKIVLAGYYVNSNGMYKPLVSRLNEDGNFDESFGTNGYMMFEAGDGHDIVCGADLQNDGKIVIGGHYWIENLPMLQYGFMAARINTDGTLDNTYGVNGVAKAVNVELAENYIMDVQVSDDNKFYGGGYISQNGQIIDASIVSFDEKGNLNTEFGSTGMVSTNFDNLDIRIEAIDIQSDGKLVIAGYAFNDNGSDYLIARYISDAINDVNEIDAQNITVSVMPNPATDFITVNFSEEGSCLVNICDISGRIVMTNEVFSNSRINVSNLPSGNYFIEVVGSNNKSACRFIKN